MKLLVLVLVLVLPAVSTLAEAQPPLRDGERDRQVLRERLEARLADARQVQERMEAALRRLDAGDPAEDVRQGLEPPRPEFRGPGGRGRSGPGMAGRGGPPGPHAPPTDREAVLNFLQEHAPELMRRLHDERQHHPRMAERLLTHMEPRIRLFMAEGDPEMRDLRGRELRASLDVLSATRDLIMARREGAPEQLRGAAEELRSALGQHFDLRQAIHEREIQILEARLEQLRREMREHLAAREELVERRVQAILQMRTPESGEGEPEAPMLRRRPR
jgi:hypothetical protein